MDHANDMREMIRTEIRSINSLEERVAFKELMESVFLALYETNEKMYQDLEHRIMDDLAYDINRYCIQTGLVERKFFDSSHHIMSAMQEDDLVQTAYAVADIKEKLEKNGTYRLTTVFLKCDYLIYNEILKRSYDFQAVIVADKEYPVQIHLKSSKRYLNQIEHLYHLFMANGIPWQTVNAPYLFKMADVCINELPNEIGDDAIITDLRINCGEYNKLVCYDMVPIWNLLHVKLGSIGFPIACGDHRNYEHIVSISQYGGENAYLVSEKSGIQNIRQTKDKLLITGEINTVKKWDIYIIRNGEQYKIDKYTYPVMRNLKKDNFSERFQRKNQRKVKTKAELERIIISFGLQDFIEYQDCYLTNDLVSQETYSMNFFMEDEIRDGTAEKKLVFTFKSKKMEEWLLRDLISFIVSEIQEIYPEYHCCGILK